MPARALIILSSVVSCTMLSWVVSCAGPSAQQNQSTVSTTDTVAVCGPQAPRNIARAGGNNTVAIPDGETPNLCNVHFHRPFEHAGWASMPEASPPNGSPVCKDVTIGDKIEFHWVYTNCNLPATPKAGLANCVCDRDDLVLRVFAKGYLVDENGGSLSQPTTDFVKYTGSTTGPSYSNETCSLAKVNWQVHPHVTKLKRDSIAEFCSSNQWSEDHAHDIRVLVEREDWLSPFSPQ